VGERREEKRRISKRGKEKQMRIMRTPYGKDKETVRSLREKCLGI